MNSERIENIGGLEVNQMVNQINQPDHIVDSCDPLRNHRGVEELCFPICDQGQEGSKGPKGMGWHWDGIGIALGWH